MDVCNDFDDIRSGEGLRSESYSGSTSICAASKDLLKRTCHCVLRNKWLVALNVQDDVVMGVLRTSGDFGDPVRPTGVGSISEACRYVMITARLNHVFVVCSYDHLFGEAE